MSRFLGHNKNVVPYRLFVAGEGWLTAGPLIHRAAERPSHDSLDARIIDAEKALAPLVFGWLRYGGGAVDVIVESAAHTTGDTARWLDPLLDRWAWSEGVTLGRRIPADDYRPGH